jgi:peptidoglycan-N-acetylglucosamine deacetylase
VPDTRWQPSRLIRASFVLHGLAAAALMVFPAHWRWTLIAVVANHALLTLLGLWPRSRWLGPNITRLPAAAVAQNQVAITIDDGPDPAVTPQVLDILETYHARATFFCIGEKAARHPALCRDIVQRGHAIENHSQHHGYGFAFSGIGGFAREIQAAQDTLTGITGRRPRFFRAPAGLRNPLLDPALSRLGLRLVAWTRRGFDTRSADAAAVCRRLTRALQAGDILLLHDGNSARTPAGTPVILSVLPLVLERCAASGLHCVTLHDALA